MTKTSEWIKTTEFTETWWSKFLGMIYPLSSCISDNWTGDVNKTKKMSFLFFFHKDKTLKHRRLYLNYDYRNGASGLSQLPIWTQPLNGDLTKILRQFLSLPSEITSLFKRKTFNVCPLLWDKL